MMRILFGALACVVALVSGACGSSGGNSTPPPPPAPVTPAPPPPPPPPVNNLENRLAQWAEKAGASDCRGQTPGFQAFAGWVGEEVSEKGKSRVRVQDNGVLGDDDNPSSHGAKVWKTLEDCSVRPLVTNQYFDVSDTAGGYKKVTNHWNGQEPGTRAILNASSAQPCSTNRQGACDSPNPTQPAPVSELPQLYRYLAGDGERNKLLVLEIASLGNKSQSTHAAWSRNLLGAVNAEKGALNTTTPSGELRIRVGGYSKDAGEVATIDAGSQECAAAEVLCLFAPWSAGPYTGTSYSAPQVSAALDAVWTAWPDMDILDLRNLAFSCAQLPEGVTGTPRQYKAVNSPDGFGDSFFGSETTRDWGHGILSLECLFDAQGPIRDLPSGTLIAGGIFGPLAGPVAGASITGFDFTGRDFGYGFARPHARENFALAAIAHGVNDTNGSAVQAISRGHALAYGRAAVRGSLWASGPLRVDLTAAGNALGAAAAWNAGGWTWGAGIAAQPEGAGSLAGSRAFRAPRTASATITAAYAKALPLGFSAHVHAAHWRTLAAQGRSLWQGAQLAESRLGASLAKRVGRHEVSVQAAWQSGLAGSLDVAGRKWPVRGIRDRGVWLTWRRGEIR